ncbi:hypothetical protein DV736_g694, partial [Chaetothyriales sp. CBS 134916]
MMPSRKRSHSEMAASDTPQEPKGQSLIAKIRSTWEFAAVMQFIYMFGKVVKIDEDFDIEDFETECLRPGGSDKLEEIGLALLKWISSHRGLNYDIWDEYTRRQYLAKAPHLNPYGDDEQAKKFGHFDIFLKLRVLHQLTVWTFWNPDRMRERMDEQREHEQTAWRIEELGYDGDDRQYYAKPKANSKKAVAARRRARKRRRIEESETPEAQEDEDMAKPDEAATPLPGTPAGVDADTLGGFKWECLAVSLADYRDVVDSFGKTKDPNERILVDRLVDEVMPTIEAAEEKQRRKIERRERELLAMEKMAHAKRSSRIADKQEREKQERDAAEVARRHAADLAAARRDRERQDQMDNERKSRMMTREQRIRDREFKRILMEEEIAHAAAEQTQIAQGHSRGSERHLEEKIAKNRKELDSLTNNAEDWYFDCSKCGMHGKNLDDGSHSVACDKCNVWQHSKCLGIAKSAAEKDDFHFVCDDCKRKEEEANRPKILLKFSKGASSSPAPPSPAHPGPSAQKTKFAAVEIPVHHTASKASMSNGYTPYPQPAVASPQRPHLPLQPNGYPQSSPCPPPPSYAPPYPQPLQSAPQPGSALPTTNSQQRPPSAGQVWNYHQPYQNTFNRQAPVSPQLYARQRPATSVWQASSPPYPKPPYAQPLSPSHTSPHPGSAHGPANGQTPAARLPSPVVNCPVMSPSQGNYDVSSVAGIPHIAPSRFHQSNGLTSPSKQPPATGTTPQHPSPSTRGAIASRTPSQPLSGISPTKNQTPSPLPPPSDVPFKTSKSPQHADQSRSVSGTPVFPPTEKLMPNPDQLSQEPVPTPTKQPNPIQLNEDELALNGDPPHSCPT